MITQSFRMASEATSDDDATEPATEFRRRLMAELSRREPLSEWRAPTPASSASSKPEMAYGTSGVGGGRPVGGANVLVIERDDDGGVIVGDVMGASYGVADTLQEAFAEWSEGAASVYQELQAEEHRLHPRLIDQLLFLRKIFG